MSEKRRTTLQGRLTVTIALVAAATVAATAIVALTLVSQSAQRDAVTQLQRDAHILAGEPHDDPAAGRRPRLDVAVRLLRAAGDHVVITNGSGTGQFFDDPIAAKISAAVIASRDIFSKTEGAIKVDGVNYAWVHVVISGRQGARAGVLLARARSSSALSNSVLVSFTIAGLLAVAAGALLARVLGRRIAGRFARLEEAAGSIAAGDLAHRIDVETGDDEEIARLAVRFNAMALSLSEARRREQELFASVSHELRTPITAIRGYAAALTDGTASTNEERERALAVIDGESARLERLVEDVGDLARLGAHERSVEIVDVDLSATLRATIAAALPVSQSAGVAIVDDVADAVVVQTDPARVHQIVSNLLDNALRVTPSGGSIRVGARAQEDGGVIVEIADTGPGIAASDLPHVFERSYLWKAYRGERPVGTGMGLAIVRELVAMLGGQIGVQSELGAGTIFRLSLPGK